MCNITIMDGVDIDEGDLQIVSDFLNFYKNSKRENDTMNLICSQTIR